MPNDSDYIGLFLRLFNDFASVHPSYTPKDAAADSAYAIKRVREEGIQFLVKTLPTLGKALDASFQAGMFVPHPSFKRAKGKTTPCFMGRFFSAVFEDDGVLRVNPCVDSVAHIRQACYMFYKLEDEYAPELVEKVIEDFLTVDAELDKVDFSSTELRPILIRAKMLIEDVFRGFDPFDIVPRPGPGASASGTPAWLRYEALTHWAQLNQAYPIHEYFYVNLKHLSDRACAYWQAPRKEAPTSRLRLVPKDSRGPRIICMEEQEIMFLQQGLADKMRSRIEAHPLTSGYVNFTNQEVNRQLARYASCTSGSRVAKATLDMKEASDRVSRVLVAGLFSGLPSLSRALLSLSTPAIHLPDGRVVETRKYAPMGSSLCFPVMSIVHFALGRAVIDVHGPPATKALADVLHVYGDDLIVNTEYADLLFEHFPRFGLKFNVGKSFTQGPFRESCGFDAFLGRNVAPQRIKKRFFDSTTPQLLTAALDVEGHLFERGYTETAQYLRYLLKARVGEDFPFVIRGSQALGWRRTQPEDVDASMLRRRYVPCYQSYQVKARVIETEPSVSMAGGWERLMRFLSGATRSQIVAGPNDKQSVAWRWVPEQALTSPAPKTELNGELFLLNLKWDVRTSACTNWVLSNRALREAFGT